MYVIDWDDVRLAPRERDLMFVLAELPGSEEQDFFAAYGSSDVNRLALAYYQHDWCVEDIGAFGVEILDTHAGEATRANALPGSRACSRPAAACRVRWQSRWWAAGYDPTSPCEQADRKEDLPAKSAGRPLLRQAWTRLQAFDQKSDDQEYEAGKGQPEGFDGQECVSVPVKEQQGKESRVRRRSRR